MAEEEKIIRDAKNGDREAFGLLYDRYAPRIYRFIFLKTGHRSDAEDLLHEVFIAAWKGIGRYEIGAFPVTSWLYQIARNRVIDHYRAAKGGVSLDELLENNALPIELTSTSGGILLEALNRKLELHEAMEAVRSLPEEQQTVVIMRFVEDLSPEEVGYAIGKTAGAVRLIQHRAIKKLKTMIETKHSSAILTINETGIRTHGTA